MLAQIQAGVKTSMRGVGWGLACSNPEALTHIRSRLHVPWNCSTSDAMCGASISSATRGGALGRLIADG